MTTSIRTSVRRNDLDWLRVLAILAVFVFHSSRFFDQGGWHVKNPTTYFGVQVWITFLGNWLMPVIFVISGASLFYALGSRGALKFVEDKVRRLFVPLVVGIFTHVMLQVYLERITHRQFFGSFWAFIPHYFEGWYGFGGNFAWMGLHLWYLLILFVFSLLFYPLLRWLRDGSGKTVLNRLGDFLALPGVVYVLALPVGWLMATLNPRDFIGIRDFGGWPLLIYLLFFLYGFVVVSHDRLQQRIQQLRGVSLAAGGVCMLALLALWASQGDPAFGSARYLQVFGIFGLSSWCWILAFLGFGFKHLTQSKPILAYANEAVLPFYVMHQTVLLCVGYFVVQWQIPDLLKYGIIAPSSFAIILALYEFAVRRVNVLRFLFGMRPLPKSEVILIARGTQGAE
jgi:peptidoglycan/LPS O-acetylase OafA/YrhL